MIIYGIKKIALSTSSVAVPCVECGHDHQWLQVYRNFFSLYFLPIVPLMKQGFICCPSCSTELKKKAFFKQLDSQAFNHEAKHYIESNLKAAKTPLYWMIAPICLAMVIIGVLMMGYHKSNLEKQFLSEYRENPISNVIVISESPADAYPFFITYVPEVRGEYAAIFAWNYSYSTLSDAKSAASVASKSIREGKLKDHFSEPYLILSEHLQADTIVHVQQEEQLAAWKQNVPLDDPEGILKLFNS